MTVVKLIAAGLLVAALQATAERYASVNDWGPLVIVTEDGRRISPRPEKDQVSARDAKIAPNHETVGWLAGAFVSKAAEIELDVKGYSSIDPYTMLSSAQPLTIYTDHADGSAGTITTRALPTLTSSSNAVTNVTVGGHVLLVPQWSIKLHGGVGTDFSPVPADDHIAFDRVDFWVLTAGANYRRGSSENLIVRNVLLDPIQTHLDIKTLGLTYAINYRF
jgi:hypothetical protein